MRSKLLILLLVAGCSQPMGIQQDVPIDTPPVVEVPLVSSSTCRAHIVRDGVRLDVRGPFPCDAPVQP